MSNQTNTIAVVAGPTACGKSALALELAARLGGEVVCADSMQLWAGLEIGSAAPTYSERAALPHHLYGSLDFAARHGGKFSAAEYVEDAAAAINEIHARGRLPVLCGGTGLYIDSLVYGNQFSPAGTDPAFREEMARYARENSPESLHALLREADPESAEAIHPANVRRVIRALEVYRLTGEKKSALDAKSRMSGPKWRCAYICLGYEDRALLYRKIEERADAMLAGGWVGEARALMESGHEADVRALGAIGYGALFDHIKGQRTLYDAVLSIKNDTRHYAKRQETWFKKGGERLWLYRDRDTDIFGKCVEYINDILNR